MYALALIKLVSIFYSSQTGKIKPLVFFVSRLCPPSIFAPHDLKVSQACVPWLNEVIIDAHSLPYEKWRKVRTSDGHDQ